MKWRRLVALSAVTGLVTTLSSCSSAREQATQQAAVDLEMRADNVVRLVAQSMADDGRGPEVAQAVPDVPDRIRVLAQTGSSLDLALQESAEAGGGLSYDSTIARMCLHIDYADPTAVTATGVPCPAVVEQEWGTAEKVVEYSTSP